MPTEAQHPPLTPVQEEPDAEAAGIIDVEVNWGGQEVSWVPKITSFKQAADQVALRQRVFKKITPGRPESSFTSALPSRAQTDRSTVTERNTQNWPVMNFRDEIGNQAQATPDGTGGWSVEFSRWVSLGIAEPTQVASFIKGIAFSLIVAGESVKASGEPEGKSVKSAGNVVMSFTQLLDLVKYGSSAWETASKKGLRAASPDIRKAAFQLVSMGAVATAAIYQAGENPTVNAVANSLAFFAALSGAGQSEAEKREQVQYQGEHFYGNPAAAASRSDLEHGFGSRSTGLTAGTSSAQTGTAGSAPASIRSTAVKVADLLPFRADAVDSSATEPAAASGLSGASEASRKKMRI